MASMAGIHEIMDTDTDIWAAVTAVDRTMEVITVHTDTADPSKIKTLLNSVTARTVLTEGVEVIPAVVMARVTRALRAVTLAIQVTLPVIMAVDTDTIDSLILTNLICS